MLDNYEADWNNIFCSLFWIFSTDNLSFTLTNWVQNLHILKSYQFFLFIVGLLHGIMVIKI